MKRRHIFLLCLALLLCCPLLLNAQSSQTNYQYWIDNNKDEAVYGTVNGEDISLSIDASALSTGVHFYNIRAYETVGSKTKWGTIYRYLFSIPRSANGVPNNLSRYEYWLDNDYEHRVTTTVNSEESEALLSIDVNSLTPGVHFYNFRAQDVDGIWGTIYRYLFSIPYPQQANGNRLITGYSYAFNDGTVTSVVFDTPVEEYQLIKAFDIPQAQPPMVIDDNCGLEFDDEEYVATLSRNINMSFSLYFKDEAESIGSPVTTDFKVEDIQTQAIQIVSVPGNATIVSHENGGFSVVCFEVPTDMELLIQTDATSSLRLYSPYSQLLDSYDASSLTEGITREFEEGTYYAVIYGNPTNITFSLSTGEPNVVNDVTFTQLGNVLTLATTTEGASIHYCVDGGEWLIYSIPLVMEGAHTVQAYAEKTGYTTSNTTSYQFNYVRPVVASPLITHEGNTITISCTTIGAIIHYTTDGTDPTVESPLYTLPFTIDSNCTIKAIAVKDGYDDSSITTFVVDWAEPCGYAILDTSTGTLTFKYGLMPDGDNVWETENTNFTIIDKAWDTNSLKAVVFDASYAEARPTSTAYWFYGAKILATITGIEYLNTSNVTNMNAMFWNCSSLTTLDVTHFDTKNVTDMTCMFMNCSNLVSLDVSYFDTKNVEQFLNTFNGCSRLTNLDVSHFNTSKAKSMAGIFSNCSNLTSIDVTNFDTSNATSIGGMFNHCTALSNVDVSNFETGNVTSMSNLFYGCSSLTNIDVSHFDTRNVTFMSDMFRDCVNLTSLDLSNFNTENVLGMSYMFSGCNNLTELDVSSFDTKNVTSMSNMFANCRSLPHLDISNFNTSKVEYMSGMFRGCSSLTDIDVSHFDTRNVISLGGPKVSENGYIAGMFQGCENLTSLNLCSFNTAKVESMSLMFYGCKKLEKVYVSEEWTTENVTNADLMFANCTALVGEKGTTYSASHVDKTYARIDNAPSAPGYFTYKAPVQKGDANGDGVIDTQDAIKVVQYYLGKNPTDFYTEAADVNNDGVVDTQDAIQIIKIYLKK